MTLDIPVAGTSLDPGLFSGKRRAPRTLRALDVRCLGAGGLVVAGRTVDVSRGGMLLELRDGHFVAPTNPSHLVPFASRLATCFPSGMAVTFGDGSVRARATIVRLVTSSAGATPILLGCRFDPALTDVDCALLGLDNDGDETTKAEMAATPAVDPVSATPTRPSGRTSAARSGRDDLLAFIEQGCDDADAWAAPSPKPKPSSRLPRAEAVAPASASGQDDDAAVERLCREARADSPHYTEPTDDDTVAYLFPVGAPFHGAHLRGRVVEIHTRALAVDLPAPAGEVDAVAWAAGAGGEVRLVCLREGAALWESRAKVRRLEAAGPGEVRFLLLADCAPPPASRLALVHLAAV